MVNPFNSLQPLKDTQTTKTICGSLDTVQEKLLAGLELTAGIKVGTEATYTLHISCSASCGDWHSLSLLNQQQTTSNKHVQVPF